MWVSYTKSEARKAKQVAEDGYLTLDTNLHADELEALHLKISEQIEAREWRLEHHYQDSTLRRWMLICGWTEEAVLISWA